MIGSVLDLADFVGFDGEWFPAQRPPGIVEPGRERRELPPLGFPCSFLEWYESWLERCETDLADAVPEPPAGGVFGRLLRYLRGGPT